MFVVHFQIPLARGVIGATHSENNCATDGVPGKTSTSIDTAYGKQLRNFFCGFHIATISEFLRVLLKCNPYLSLNSCSTLYVLFQTFCRVKNAASKWQYKNTLCATSIVVIKLGSRWLSHRERTSLNKKIKFFFKFGCLNFENVERNHIVTLKSSVTVGDPTKTAASCSYCN